MTDNIKPTVQEQTAWAKVPQEFNDWWNSDYSDESNPFRINSAAYWAWAGWSEAVRLNATVPDGFVPQTCPHCNETWLMEAQQPLTDEQCDAIYTALDAWARKADACEFGLPRVYRDGAKGGREIIRDAISGVKND